MSEDTETVNMEVSDAVEILKSFVFGNFAVSSKVREAIDMAIKALEQSEPCEKVSTINLQITKIREHISDFSDLNDDWEEAVKDFEREETE